MTAFPLPARWLGAALGQESAFRRFLALSAVLHVIVLSAAATATLFRSRPVAYSPSYTVDLVSLPSPPRAAAAAPKGAAPSAVTAPAPKPAAKPAAPMKAAAPPRAPASGKTVETPKAKGALPVLSGQGDEAAQVRAKRKRIEELQKEAERLYESILATGGPSRPSTPAAGGPGGPPTARPAGAGPPGAAGPVSGGSGGDLRMKAYYDRVWEEIKASWVLPSGIMSADQHLVAVLGIRIAANGSIEHYWIEKPSGNIYYDQSAIRAINKASPLPPPPSELGGAALEVGVNFRVSE